MKVKTESTDGRFIEIETENLQEVEALLFTILKGKVPSFVDEKGDPIDEDYSEKETNVNASTKEETIDNEVAVDTDNSYFDEIIDDFSESALIEALEESNSGSNVVSIISENKNTISEDNPSNKTSEKPPKLTLESSDEEVEEWFSFIGWDEDTFHGRSNTNPPMDDDDYQENLNQFLRDSHYKGLVHGADDMKRVVKYMMENFKKSAFVAIQKQAKRKIPTIARSLNRLKTEILEEDEAKKSA